MSVEHRLSELGLALPRLSPPVANYAPFVRYGGMLFVSGNLPLRDGLPTHVGAVPHAVPVTEAYIAAQTCALNIIAQIAAAVDGDFDQVKQIIKVTGLVNCAADFKDLANVMDGASDLFRHAFGERGTHARTTFGAVTLPRGATVEVDAIVAIA